MTSYQLRIVKREWDPARKARVSHSLITKTLSESEVRQLVELLKSPNDIAVVRAVVEGKEGRTI
ncbi:MAG: hypothetical protein JRN37_06425 [Nitrososphaerota archaeon]|nr:hypothetical protein [Nitrososphaerota archaeon]